MITQSQRLLVHHQRRLQVLASAAPVTGQDHPPLALLFGSAVLCSSRRWANFISGDDDDDDDNDDNDDNDNDDNDDDDNDNDGI